MFEHFIEKLRQTKDMNYFQRFVSSIKDINQNLVESEDNSLNLLHICIGLEETDFSLKCIQFLLSFPKLNVNSFAKIDGIIGITGAHIAVDWRHYRALDLLISHGIDLFLCDSYGRSPKDYAIERSDKRAQNMIEEAINHYMKTNSSQLFGNQSTKSSFKFKRKSVNDLPEVEEVFESKPKTPNETDLDKTIEYFDENHNIFESEDNSGESLLSNISYEKTNSLKSCSQSSQRSEVYVYNDKDHNVVLIEERFEGCANSSHSSDDNFDVISKGSATQSSDEQHIKEIDLMSGTQIFSELRAMGDSPGPILESTKKYYKRRLLNLRRGGTPSPSKKVLALPQHPPELNLLLENKFPFEETLELEKQFIDFFETKDYKQNNFIYLLIDPNISENIPLQANTTKIVVNCCAQINTKLFIKFIKSVFYVGKGQGNRVYQHFYEAIKSENSQQMCPKVKRIHQIWSSDKGVTSLHCFHNISPKEALAREAMIIEALGLNNLTNQVNGQLIRGLKWNQRKRRIFGSYLLFKAFGIYILTGERQIRRPLRPLRS